MDARSLLESFFQSGQQMATSGQDYAERKLGVPEKGRERDAMVSGLGKGALVGGALALLFGSRPGRRTTRKAVKLAGLAALGSLAYNAYRKWQGGTAAQGARAAGETNQPDAQRLQTTLLRAMIAAAKADGHIDLDERGRIEEQLRDAGLDSDTREFLHAELSQPANARQVAASVQSPEEASEVYLASRMVLDVDNEQERRYLADLAKELRLAPDLVRELEQQAEAAEA